MDRAELIRRGNIVFTEWTGEREVGCFLGNGRFGAVMASTGLNLRPEYQDDPGKNRSHYRHIRHWGRFALTSRYTGQGTSEDYILPLFRLCWEKEFQDISEYRQCHDLYDGVLRTRFAPAHGESISVVTWFDAVRKDLTGARIDASEGAAGDNRICLCVPTPFNPWGFTSDGEYTQDVSVGEEDGEWRITVSCADTLNQVRTQIHIRTDMAVERHGTGLWFRLHGGANSLLISVGEPVARDTTQDSLQRTMAQNHRQWKEIGWLEYPQDQMQRVWVRSMAYLLSSYDAKSEYVQPANGLGINGFPFNFVPDMANIAPALMMLGRWDIAAHWVEKFASEIEDMRDYARFLWPEAEGIFPPWQLNYGPYEGYHRPSAPMIFFYEAHNTGYLCKLAMEAAGHSGDAAWNQRVAYPLIRECAKFFAKFCHREQDGQWHLRWYPCMGRDEAGGVNKEDYLCTLIAAKYTFRAAIECRLDPDGAYARILSDGLAFSSLRSERGVLHTCRGCDDFGKQKHPIQLEGIANFPSEIRPSEEEEAAYRLRHDLTVEARVPRFYGWTLAELLLADTNMNNSDEWLRDWSLLRPSDNTDEGWVQFYESSGMHRSAFYTATHGMILLSLIRNCVNDFWGKLEIGACLPKDTCVRFGNIRTCLGITVSGTIDKGRATGSLTADRDTTFEWRGSRVSMRRGETITYNYTT